MAALNFPSNPSNGQTYTANNVTYVWNGTAWKKNIPSQSPVSGINTVGGVVGIANDLDVDGHTNLDNVSVSGVVTATSLTLNDYIYHSGDLNTFIGFESDNTIRFNTNGSDKLKINSSGHLIILDDNDTYINRPLNDTLSFTTGGTERLNINNSGATVTGILSATSFSGDGSNLTGTSLVKQVREATSTGQSSFQSTSFQDKVSLTVSGISNNSRMVVIASYTISTSTPFGSGWTGQGRCIKVGGDFEGEEIINGHNGYGESFYNILYDSANGAGSRTYTIQARRLQQQTVYISNAKILAIELGIGP